MRHLQCQEQREDDQRKDGGRLLKIFVLRRTSVFQTFYWETREKKRVVPVLLGSGVSSGQESEWLRVSTDRLFSSLSSSEGYYPTV